LHVTIVNSNGTASDFLAVQDQIVSLGAYVLHVFAARCKVVEIIAVW